MNANESRRSVLVWAALTGVVVVCAYAVVALVQILVWNPEAAVPGLTADEIWRQVGEAQQGPPNAFVVGVIALGPMMAIVLFALFVVTEAGVWSTVAGYLALLVMGGPGYFVASFGPGMGLADTYYISGGDASGAGLALGSVSLLALVALIAVFIGAFVRDRRERRLLAA
ncbi:hypothetical protein [Microbacterium testaceum]|nr:hypothetical protein [Microbacterium testaceum]